MNILKGLGVIAVLALLVTAPLIMVPGLAIVFLAFWLSTTVLKAMVKDIVRIARKSPNKA